jgi:hypothetical protein
MFVLSLFAHVCLAQAPRPAVVGSASNEVSVNFILPVKGPDFSMSGYGGQIAGTRYINEHLGIELQGDYERAHWYGSFRDAGVRVGPTVHFLTKRSAQPYVEALMGYARVEASYLKPVTSYHGSGSALAGAGLDFRLSGGWYGKTGADLEGDWTARTRVVRGFLGLSYKFGAR